MARGLRCERFVIFGSMAIMCTAALAHGGGQDRYGCHLNKATGIYHCHSGPLAGQSFPDREAMLDELERRGIDAETVAERKRSARKAH